MDTFYPSALNGHVFLDVHHYKHCVDIDHKDILLNHEQTEYEQIVVLTRLDFIYKDIGQIA